MNRQTSSNRKIALDSRDKIDYEKDFGGLIQFTMRHRDLLMMLALKSCGNRETSFEVYRRHRFSLIKFDLNLPNTWRKENFERVKISRT